MIMNHGWALYIDQRCFFYDLKIQKLNQVAGEKLPGVLHYHPIKEN